MKKLFTSIKNDDFNEVKRIISKNPKLVNCISKNPPKKDDGQSPLQIAIRYGKFDIADFLIDNGADINFIETESCNKWRAPVLHDAITATIMSSRFLIKDIPNKKWVISEKNYKEAYKILKKLINNQVVLNCKDSFGNSTIERAVLDAKQILPRIHYDDPDWVDDRPLNKELINDLNKVFKLLKKTKVDFNVVDRHYGKAIAEKYKNEPVYRFIK